MYFLEVKAYLSAPSVWWCADWRRMDIVLYIGGLILGICILAFLLIYNRNRIPNDKVDVLPSAVLLQYDDFLSTDKIVSEDEVVCSLGNAKYQLREILFNENGTRPSVCNKCFRKETIGNNMFPENISIAEDLVFLFLVFPEARKICF